MLCCASAPFSLQGIRHLCLLSNGSSGDQKFALELLTIDLELLVITFAFTWGSTHLLKLDKKRYTKKDRDKG